MSGTPQILHPIAIVTGASRGIGHVLASNIAKTGHKVYALARDETALRELAGEFPAVITPYPLDIRDSQAVRAFYAHLDENNLQPHILINNAGTGIFKHMEDITDSEWQGLLDTNLNGMFYMTRGAVKRMKLLHSGTVVNMISVAGRQPFKNGSAYAAVKFGLDGFTRVIREELRKFRIRVIAVYPGATASTWWQNIPGSENLPFEKMLKPERVADLVIQAILQPDDTVVEELFIRNVSGNF